MKSPEAITVLKNRFAKIEKHYNNLLEDFEHEEIRSFRLHTKKLNAFLSLINSDRNAKSKSKVDGSLQTFYEAVGQLRNVQLHRAKINRMCDDLSLQLPCYYLQQLNEVETKAKDAARTLALKNPMHKQLQKLIHLAPVSITQSAVENFVATHKHQLIKLLLVNNYPDENLHAIRKLIKQVLYVWDWVKEEIVSKPASACMQKTFCVALCEKLGDFQDCCTVLRFLNAYLLGGQLVDEEITTLFTIGRHTQEQKEQLKNTIVEELQSFVKKFWEADVLLPIYEYL